MFSPTHPDNSTLFDSALPIDSPAPGQGEPDGDERDGGWEEPDDLDWDDDSPDDLRLPEDPNPDDDPEEKETFENFRNIMLRASARIRPETVKEYEGYFLNPLS